MQIKLVLWKRILGVLNVINISINAEITRIIFSETAVCQKEDQSPLKLRSVF